MKEKRPEVRSQRVRITNKNSQSLPVFSENRQRPIGRGSGRKLLILKPRIALSAPQGRLVLPVWIFYSHGDFDS